MTFFLAKRSRIAASFVRRLAVLQSLFSVEFLIRFNAINIENSKKAKNFKFIIERRSSQSSHSVVAWAAVTCRVCRCFALCVCVRFLKDDRVLSIFD